ncbi:MAG TPA: YbhN family protein [Candidatus Saccharimonadales bacterium]|nr:YbhN family protein [Candidatus Saccharimonadales bacterium]
MVKQKPPAKPQPKRSPLLKVVLSVGVLAAAVYVLITHWHIVQSSLQVARGASTGWLVVSVGLMALTFAIAAGIYGALALHRLHYFQTLLIEVAAAFVNRLLPSGLGGLGLHGVYLYKRKHTAAEATVVVSVNNLIGMAAHLILLGLVLTFNHSLLLQFVNKWHLQLHWWYGLVLLVVVGVTALPPVRRRLGLFMHNLAVSVCKISPRSLVRALGLAALLTTTYTLILFAATRSLGLHLALLQVFIVFSLGMLTSTATPTPGGLVGAEAGLFAGLVVYSVPTSTAGAAVVLFRLVSYWLPLVPGVLALLLARRRRLA